MNLFLWFLIGFIGSAMYDGKGLNTLQCGIALSTVVVITILNTVLFFKRRES